ncbi:MAG: Rab family GTPase, partial [Candidatus Hodarchaeota archaeon]
NIVIQTISSLRSVIGEMSRIVLKIVLMGDGAVGKTALRKNYFGLGFKKTYMATLGADFAVKTQKISYKGERTIEFQIWDLAGQPRFENVRGAYYRGCKGGLLCFDISRRETAENLEGWYREAVKNSRKRNFPVVVVANKIDLRLEVENALSHDEGLVFAENLQKKNEDSIIRYIETSAKTGDNVVEAFEAIAIANLEQIEKKLGSIDSL